MKETSDLLHGTLELLILKTLMIQPRHGWGIAKHIQHISNDVLDIGQGSLYPALYRLEDRGWIEAEWGVAESGRRAKFYSITPQGLKQVASEEAQWQAFSWAVNRVLGSAR